MSSCPLRQYGVEMENRMTLSTAKASLKERLSLQMARLSAEAGDIPPLSERDAVARKARQAEVAGDLEKWMSSPGLRTPS